MSTSTSISSSSSSFLCHGQQNHPHPHHPHLRRRSEKMIIKNVKINSCNNRRRVAGVILSSSSSSSSSSSFANQNNNNDHQKNILLFPNTTNVVKQKIHVLPLVVLLVSLSTATPFSFSRAHAANNNNNNNNKSSSSSSLSTSSSQRKEPANYVVKNIRALSKDCVKQSLTYAKTTIEKIDRKINDPWNVEDVWTIFALRYAIRKRREIFLWIEIKKSKLFKKNDNNNNDDVTIEQLSRDDDQYRKTFQYWVGKPLGVLSFLWIAGYIFDVTCEFIDAMYVDFAVPSAITNGFDRGSYILSGGVMASMWITKYGSQVLTKLFPDSEVEEGKQLILVRFTTMITLFATFAATLVTFGLPTSLLFSFGGLGGLAFGLAAKDFIANLIGGVIIAVTSPFSEGDKIVLLPSGGKFRGSDEPNISEYRVQKIGWYSTLLMPRDKKPTIVPNGYFLGNATINHSRATHRFVRGAFEIRYEDVSQAIKIKETLNEFLAKHPNVDVKAGSKCLITKLGGAKLQMEIRAFIPMRAGGSEDIGGALYYDLRQDVCLEVCKVLEKYAPKSAGTTPVTIAYDHDGYGPLMLLSSSDSGIQ